MASDGRAEFDPSEIARVDFPTAFRGYDQDAVRRYLSRLAAAVGRAQELGLLGTVDPDSDDERLIELELEAGKLRQRVGELEAALDESRAEPGIGSPAASAEGGQPLDEAELIKLLGAETARILETARSAAADMAKRAESEAAQVKQLSEAEARARRDEAERALTAARTEAADVVAAAEAEAARAQTRIASDTARAAEESRLNAEQVLAEAAGQADAELSAARLQANGLVTDAEEMRKEILGDLVTRRRLTREQLVVMNAARDRLAVALSSARNELDDVTSILQRAAPAQDEIDVREPSADLLAQAVAQSSGGGPTAEAQRAEVGELVALLDRNRSNGSVAHGVGGVGPSADGTRAPAANGTSDTGTGLGAGTALADGNGASGGNGLAGANGSANTNANGTGGNGLAPGPLMADGIPMEYLTLGPDALLLEDRLESPLTPQSPVVGDVVDDVLDDYADDEGEPLVLTDTEHALAERIRPRVSPNGSELRLESYGSLGVTPAAILANGSGSMQRSATRGDLPRNTPYAGVLPSAFEGRDVALSRATPGFRRRLKRAVNDDQSEVLERLRAGRGAISASELPPVEHQLETYTDALRPVLFDVVTSGAEMLGCLDIPGPSVESLCLQLARHLVDCLRTPTVAALERNTGNDREAILDPIRSIYRDFRNSTLPEVIEDALHEAFALGLFHAIAADELVLWMTDPRLDPDPICEDNSASRALVKGSSFPSGHPRPLSMPGCRCLLVPAG